MQYYLYPRHLWASCFPFRQLSPYWKPQVQIYQWSLIVNVPKERHKQLSFILFIYFSSSYIYIYLDFLQILLFYFLNYILYKLYYIFNLWLNYLHKTSWSSVFHSSVHSSDGGSLSDVNISPPRCWLADSWRNGMSGQQRCPRSFENLL